MKYVAYRRRWYILLVYSLTGFAQGYFWNMWGPIYFSMQRAFGWDQRQLALMPLYGTTTFMLCVLPSAMILAKLGLRYTMLIMAGLTALSALIRCIPLTSNIGFSVLVNLSGIINGIPGAWTWNLPAFISAHWFPVHERRFSTAVGTLLNTLGIACSFIVGPALVSEPNDDIADDSIRREYNVYTYIEAAFGSALFLAVLAYFPNQPPTSPSASADDKRINYMAACKQLLRSRNFWLIAAPFILVTGVHGGWISTLDINLNQNDVDQAEAGWMGFYSCLAGAVLGIATGRLGDYFGRLKAIQVAICLLAAEASLWVLLVCEHVISFSLRSTYIAVILLGTWTASLIPINFEFATELCYPVDEAVVVALIGLLSCIPSGVFLGILFTDDRNVSWMNYFLASACCAAVPFAFLVPAHYRRTAVDAAANEIEHVTKF